MKKKILAITILMASFGGALLAQQDAMFTHYMYNTLAVNPAYAGSRDAVTVTGLHRSQWVGFDGAPTTQTLTLHSPIFTDALGAGLSIVNDVIGPIKQTSFYADFAYRAKLNSKTKLAFGLKGGGSLFQADLTSIQTSASNDQAFSASQNEFLPNIGAGIYVSNEKWYAGVSIPKLLENDLVANSQGSLSIEKRHYFLIAGFITKLSNKVKLKPTTFVKATEAAPIQADVTAMFVFNDKLELGIAGRTNDGVGALIGFNFTPQLRAGYSFDWSFNNTTGAYNSGSHEVMLRYDLIRNLDKTTILSPRYF